MSTASTGGSRREARGTWRNDTCSAETSIAASSRAAAACVARRSSSGLTNKSIGTAGIVITCASEA